MSEETFPVIVIEGIISCGKSTLLKYLQPHLEKYFRTHTVPEPVEKWQDNAILGNFYRDPKRWSFTFQIEVLEDRLQLVEDAYKTCVENKSELFITERSIYADEYFAKVLLKDGNMSQYEYDLYRKMWSRFENSVKLKPDLVIYLRPGGDNCAQICMDRLHKRDRGEESGVSKEYQEKLLAEHDIKLLQQTITIASKEVPILVLDHEEDIKTKSNVLISIVEKIKVILAKEESSI
jgi:deoxyadenosine/deoxycytidine kinase